MFMVVQQNADAAMVDNLKNTSNKKPSD